MYYEHFGLNWPPYKITPDPDLFYSGGERGAILNALIYAIVNGDAIIKVVGEVGCGKTMLCRVLESKLPEQIQTVYLANPSLSPENILHAIAFELGLPEANSGNRLQVMKALQDYLLKKHTENHQVVVFIEEAQSMPLETLEEIRLLSNLETRHHKLLQIVLFGQPELDERLSTPHVRQIKERITNSFNLAPLAGKDIQNYLTFRLRLAGCSNELTIFQRGAVRLIARASAGLMRRINILADKALLAAYTENSHIIKPRHVRAAMHDCEFVSDRQWKWPVVAVASCMSAALAVLGWAYIGSNVSAGWNYDTASTNDLEQALRTPTAAGIVQPIHKKEAELTQPGPAWPLASKVRHSTPFSLIGERLEVTQNWLSQANPKHFSIQVLITDIGQDSALERLFQHKDIELEELYVHWIDIRGKKMLGMLYGDYPDYLAANTALKQLPDVLRRYNPYLRRIQYILAESVPSGN